MEQSVIISFSLPADLLVGLGHAAKAAGRPPADHLRAIVRQALLETTALNSAGLPEVPVPAEATVVPSETGLDSAVAEPEAVADPGDFAEPEFFAELVLISAPDLVAEAEAVTSKEPTEPGIDCDGCHITARVLAQLQDVKEPAPEIVPEAQSDTDEDPVLKLVKAVCAVAQDDLAVETSAEAPLIPSDDMIAAELAGAWRAEVVADNGEAPSEAKLASSFGAMTYGILATRNDHRDMDQKEESEVTDATAEAESALVQAGAPQPKVSKDDGLDLSTEDVLAAVLSVTEPSTEAEPDLLSDGHLMRIIKTAPGWLDLQRTLRREGLVLRLSDCGQSLLLHSWPEDRLLMPLSALGLTLEGLCLHFRAPFPGGGGLSRVLRALVATESDTGRAA